MNMKDITIKLPLAKLKTAAVGASLKWASEREAEREELVRGLMTRRFFGLLPGRTREEAVSYLDTDKNAWFVTARYDAFDAAYQSMQQLVLWCDVLEKNGVLEVVVSGDLLEALRPGL